MQRVADLVNRGEYGQALVRLWMIAGQNDGQTLRLNAWERTRDANGFGDQVGRFRRDLQSETAVTAEAIDAAPLAFVVALDETTWLLHTSQPSSGQLFEEDRQRFWLLPTELSAERTPLGRQTGNREAWFRRHRVVPEMTTTSIHVNVIAATGRLAEFCHELAAKDEFALLGWIGHFDDSARLKSDLSSAGRFWLLGLSPPDVRQDSIRDALNRAAADGAHVVLLPEFTVDLAGRKVVATWLLEHSDHPFCLVVAGSFHEDTGKGRFNTAELLNHLGERLFVHRKLRLYGSAEGLAEYVGVGNSMTVLVTAIGTLTVLICRTSWTRTNRWRPCCRRCRSIGCSFQATAIRRLPTITSSARPTSPS
jgi:hypothetical protein